MKGEFFGKETHCPIKNSVSKFFDNLAEKIQEKVGLSKASLSSYIQNEFNLIKDRSVYYNEKFAIRFSSSKSLNFSNTVLSLSILQKYDELPFIVCLVTPKENKLFLANSTFLNKISHSSQELRENNIKGSFNGSDIVKEFQGLYNSYENFDDLLAIHAEIEFAGNLPRLVENTSGIVGTGSRFKPTKIQKNNIFSSIKHSISFYCKTEYKILKQELDEKCVLYENEIILASLIENVNLRGRLIEYLISSEENNLKDEIVKLIRERSNEILKFRTDNALGDYLRDFDDYSSATDIKTKVMVLKSNPKGYNIDKLLEFLAKEKSVFLFYFVGIEPNNIFNKVLISVFDEKLLENTILLKHWAGRNSRGVTQFKGEAISEILKTDKGIIDERKSLDFVKSLIELGE